MKSDNPNVQRWLDNEHFQNFMRQVHTDIYVGLKNGVSADDIEEALTELADHIAYSVDLNPADASKRLFQKSH